MTRTYPAQTLNSLDRNARVEEEVRAVQRIHHSNLQSSRAGLAGDGAYGGDFVPDPSLVAIAYVLMQLTR